MFRFFLALCLAILCQGAPQGSQYPDNYSVYVRALQHGEPATPRPYASHADSGPSSPSGGYSPPLAPQSYRRPLQAPQPQHQSPYGSQSAYSFPQQPVPPAPTPAPVAPQVRPFPQYQPPLLPPYNPPSPPQQPQIHQATASVPAQQPQINNQQLIYVGGQQRQYNSLPASAPLPVASVSSPPRQAPSSAAQPVSFSTSITSDQANRQSKVVGSARQAPAQAIQKAPASEIQFDKKVIAAKDKDANKKKDDEYVIYYYYYYDDKDKKNLTLNFDDIPNLEQFDKENRTARGHQVVANGVPNSLQHSRSAVAQSQNEFLPTQSPRSATAVSVSVSVSEGPQHVSPKSNVYRYGGGEIPRSPILKPTPEAPVQEPSSTQGFSPESLGNPASSSDPRLQFEVSSVAPTVAVGPETPSESKLDKPAEDINDVGDQKADIKKVEVTEIETTTTEASTTEEPSTTTKAPKRGSGFGDRRRFGGPSRLPPSRRPSAASTAAAADNEPTPTTRRPNPLNRQRPRRPVGESTRIRPTRPRRPVKEEVPEEDEEHKEEASSSTTEASTTAASRRFGSGNRSRFQSTRTSTEQPTSAARPALRTRPTRPSGGLPRTRPSGRPRGSRPPFSRTKAPEEDEPKEESSPTTQEEPNKSSESPATSESPAPASAAPEETPEAHSEDGEAAENTSAAPEPSRRNPLLRPRSRNPLFGNRPRASLANRGQASN